MMRYIIIANKLVKSIENEPSFKLGNIFLKGLMSGAVVEYIHEAKDPERFAPKNVNKKRNNKRPLMT